MDRLKKHEDEIDFFARELQCRRILYCDWKPVSKLVFFGRSIALPPLNLRETYTAALNNCGQQGTEETESGYQGGNQRYNAA
jgi:hypothetical protein